MLHSKPLLNKTRNIWCARRDDFILFNSLGLTLLGLVLPGWQTLPLVNGHGLVVMLLLHASVAEWLYYWFHRALHHHWLYTRYHSHHHQSFVTEPITGAQDSLCSWDVQGRPAF